MVFLVQKEMVNCCYTNRKTVCMKERQNMGIISVILGVLNVVMTVLVILSCIKYLRQSNKNSEK